MLAAAILLLQLFSSSHLSFSAWSGIWHSLTESDVDWSCLEQDICQICQAAVLNYRLRSYEALYLAHQKILSIYYECEEHDFSSVRWELLDLIKSDWLLSLRERVSCSQESKHTCRSAESTQIRICFDWDSK
jgi:hypothetical protein